MKHKEVVEKLKQYQENNTTQMFSEFVNLLGLTWSEWCDVVMNNPEDKTVKLLLLYKEHLEVQIEKEMVYQKQGKFYNHNAAQFVLKKMNPLKYGDKVMSMSVDAKASGFKLQGELKNTSELNLVEKLNS